MERESMLMYRSTRDMLQDLKKENKDQYLTALEMYMDYAFDGIEPDISELSLILKLFWKAAKPLIDANNRNYLNGCKGGAPSESMKGNQNAKKKKQTENKPKTNPKQTQNKGNVNVKDNVKDTDTDNAHVKDTDNVNVNVNVNVNDKEKEPLSDSELNEDDGYFIPEQDASGRWMIGGEYVSI